MLLILAPMSSKGYPVRGIERFVNGPPAEEPPKKQPAVDPDLEDYLKEGEDDSEEVVMAPPVTKTANPQKRPRRSGQGMESHRRQRVGPSHSLDL